MSLEKTSAVTQREAMTLITGATGNIGCRVAELLSKHGKRCA
jgi:short-subunit dehydrogenase